MQIVEANEENESVSDNVDHESIKENSDSCSSIYSSDDETLQNELKEDEKEDADDIDYKIKEFFPFSSQEGALIYLWAHRSPSISRRKLQDLLTILHASGFSISKLSKTVNMLRKERQRLPSIKILEFLPFFFKFSIIFLKLISYALKSQ